MVSTFTRASFATLITAAAIGCGASPTEPNPDGLVRVAGAVRDIRSNNAIAGARVAIGSLIATTDGAGWYSLTLPPGEHAVSINDQSHGLVRLTVPAYRGDFYLRVAGCVARYGTVIDRQSRRPIAGATVSIGGGKAVTDRDGWFVDNLGCPGAPCIGFNTTFATVSHPSYTTAQFVVGRGICFVDRVDYELVRR